MKMKKTDKEKKKVKMKAKERGGKKEKGMGKGRAEGRDKVGKGPRKDSTLPRHAKGKRKRRKQYEKDKRREKMRRVGRAKGWGQAMSESSPPSCQLSQNVLRVRNFVVNTR